MAGTAKWALGVAMCKLGSAKQGTCYYSHEKRRGASLIRDARGRERALVARRNEKSAAARATPETKARGCATRGNCTLQQRGGDASDEREAEETGKN